MITDDTASLMDMLQQPPLRDAEALRSCVGSEKLIETCFWTRVPSLSLRHGAEESSVDVGGEMTDLTAEIHNDGQRTLPRREGVGNGSPRWLRLQPLDRVGDLPAERPE